MSTDQVGIVSSLWRYPVKSMMGEVVISTGISEQGIDGDRAYALVDNDSGKIVSAKNPKLWPNMFSFRSRYSSKNVAAGKAVITLPDGTTVSSDQNNVNAVLSSALGRDVTLVSQVPKNPQLEEYWPDMEELDNRDIVTDENMPAGTFYDLAIVHILTSSTLEKLAEVYPDGQFDVRRFRPNIFVNSGAGNAEFVENEWIGKTIAIGSEVKLKITEPCPRCVMTTLAQGSLQRDTGILRAAAQNNNAHVGVYAEVIQAGSIQCEDPLTIVRD